MAWYYIYWVGYYHEPNDIGQSLTIINAGFVFYDKLRMSADDGYHRFLTPESIIDRYPYNDS